MSKESDLDAHAAALRDFVDQEVPDVAEWNTNVTRLRTALGDLGDFFTDTDDAHDALLTRFDLEHDVLGKHTPPSQWIRDPATPIFLDASRFQFVGNRVATGDYLPGERVRVFLGSPAIIRAVKAISYDAGPNRTTITLDGTPALTSAISAVDTGLVRQSMPKVRETDLMPILGNIIRGARLESVSATQITVTVDEAVIGGMPVVIDIPPLPLTTAAGNGANRLDTGSWTAGVPYAAYLCTNETGTAATVTASLSFAGVPSVMPGSYTRAAYLGAIYCLAGGGSPTLVPIVQQRGRTDRDAVQVFSSTTFTDAPTVQVVDCQAVVPPGVRVAFVDFYFAMINPGVAGLRQLNTKPGTTIAGFGVASTVVYSAKESTNYVAGHRQLLDANRRFALWVSAPVGDAELYTVQAYVVGWEDPIAA